MGLISSIYASTSLEAGEIHASPKANHNRIKKQARRARRNFAAGGHDLEAAIKPGSRKQEFHTAGAVVSLKFHNRENATLQLKTSYPMPDAIRFGIMAELKNHATRKRTQPQINAQGGFCSHIQARKALGTAQRVLMMARRGYIEFMQHQQAETPADRSGATAAGASKMRANA